MNYNSNAPKQLVIKVAIMAALSCVLFLLISIFLSNIINNIVLVVFSGLFVFVLVYYTLKYALNKSLYDQLRGLYKLIYDVNEKDGSIESFESNVVEEMRNEVLKWASKKKEEVKDLQESALYRKEFLGNVSHELKTPTFNVQGYIDTLIDGAIEDPKVNMRYLIKASKSVDRMIAIVNDLEEISKLETGKLNVNYQTFDLLILIREVFESFEISVEAKGIRLNLNDHNWSSLMVYADQDLVRHILENLIGNSIKYGKENGQTLIDFFDVGDNILIEVQDDGIGIEKKHLSHLFERFYRVDSSRSRDNGGTGLGLSIVKHIVEAHEQTIRVTSVLGRGSNFAFTLKRV